MCEAFGYNPCDFDPVHSERVHAREERARHWEYLRDRIAEIERGDEPEEFEGELAELYDELKKG